MNTRKAFGRGHSLPLITRPPSSRPARDADTQAAYLNRTQKTGGFFTEKELDFKARSFTTHCGDKS